MEFRQIWSHWSHPWMSLECNLGIVDFFSWDNFHYLNFFLMKVSVVVVVVVVLPLIDFSVPPSLCPPLWLSLSWSDVINRNWGLMISALSANAILRWRLKFTSWHYRHKFPVSYYRQLFVKSIPKILSKPLFLK